MIFISELEVTGETISFRDYDISKSYLLLEERKEEVSYLITNNLNNPYLGHRMIFEGGPNLPTFLQMFADEEKVNIKLIDLNTEFKCKINLENTEIK